jgi:hypothetical protein
MTDACIEAGDSVTRLQSALLDPAVVHACFESGLPAPIAHEGEKE